MASRPGLSGGLVGLVFQGPSLLPDLDAAQNVALPLLLAGVPEAAALLRAGAALAGLGIGALAMKLPAQMSGGQAQRVAVAWVLAARPAALILADEPTGQLDRANADRVLSGGAGIACRDPRCGGPGAVRDPAARASSSTYWATSSSLLSCSFMSVNESTGSDPM